MDLGCSYHHVTNLCMCTCNTLQAEHRLQGDWVVKRNGFYLVAFKWLTSMSDSEKIEQSGSLVSTILYAVVILRGLHRLPAE